MRQNADGDYRVLQEAVPGVLESGEKCQSVSGEGRGGESKNIVLKTTVRSLLATKGNFATVFF